MTELLKLSCNLCFVTTVHDCGTPLCCFCCSLFSAPFAWVQVVAIGVTAFALVRFCAPALLFPVSYLIFSLSPIRQPCRR